MENFSRTKAEPIAKSFNLKELFVKMKEGGLLEEIVISNKTYWVIKPVEEK